LATGNQQHEQGEDDGDGGAGEELLPKIDRGVDQAELAQPVHDHSGVGEEQDGSDGHDDKELSASERHEAPLFPLSSIAQPRASRKPFSRVTKMD